MFVAHRPTVALHLLREPLQDHLISNGTAFVEVGVSKWIPAVEVWYDRYRPLSAVQGYLLVQPVTQRTCYVNISGILS